MFTLIIRADRIRWTIARRQSAQAVALCLVLAAATGGATPAADRSTGNQSNPAVVVDAAPPAGLPAGAWSRIRERVNGSMGSSADTRNATEHAKVIASDGEANDQFGLSVAVSGDTMVVGAWADDDAGSASGAAYLFARNQGGADNWGQILKLTASDAAAGDHFGRAVAISGDTVVVGAHGDDHAGTYSGSAYVFERNQGGKDQWGETRKLTASDAAEEDYFGRCVAVEGDTVVVGAWGDDDAGLFSGAAYIYERNQGGADNWGEVRKLTASDAAPGGYLGWSVSISSDRVVTGAYGDDDAGNKSGAAYLFERNEGGVDNWGEVRKLTASDAAPNDGLGWSVGISGDTVVVGADGNDDAGAESGAAYVFERNKGGADSWGQRRKLTASDGAAEDHFGFSVAIDGETVIVGSYGDDDSGSESGAAYLFTRNEGGANTWGEVRKLTASDAEGGDELGCAIAIGGNTVVAGAYRDRNAFVGTGSAYLFSVTPICGWIEHEKLVASDREENDEFGVSVATNGDRVVVGGWLEDSAGVNSGAAYIFDRNQGGVDNWGEALKITASDAAPHDSFGRSLAISGDTAVVGAYRDDDAGLDSGAAYILERNEGGADNWGEVRKITASDAAPLDLFGQTAIAISGDTVVVGAYEKDDTGAAYIFERNQGGMDHWGEVRKILASDGAADDRFGYAVAISGDTVVVGAHEDDDPGTNSGSAYIFERNQGGADNWGEVRKITASDAESSAFFGVSVAISGDTLVVGAHRQPGAAPNAGAAYIFERNQDGANNWGEVRKIQASDGAAQDYFGHSVAIHGDTVVIGALGNDDAGSLAGSVYLFERNEGGPDNWGEIRLIIGSEVGAADYFGESVALSDDTLVVGAKWDDVPAIDAGSAYVGKLGLTMWYPDDDQDLYGDPMAPVINCSAPVGYVADHADCDDADGDTYPDAPQVCDGINNDCSDPSWPDVPADEADGDSDGFMTCEGDCDDTEGATHPGATEINDGQDNQCPGEEGYGQIDEIELCGFFNPDDENEFFWTAQTEATSYQVARSIARTLPGGTVCFSNPDSVTSVTDPTQPAPGVCLYYLVRALTPHAGSWGVYSDGTERAVSCP